jgi:DNA-binding transcriptional ArsR family regulator
MEAMQLDIKSLTALAEPTRVRIVELLRGGALTVGEVANELKIKQPQASKHLKVLSECRILQFRAEANRRIYSVNDDSFKKLSEWAQTFIRVMDERFDKLDGYLEQIQKPNKKKENKSGK